MVKVYAIVLTVGLLALIGWVFARSFSTGTDRQGVDPEERFGVSGRRVVAAAVGFGMGGMSAEFSPRDLSWPVALLAAVAGAGAAAWYAGWLPDDEDPAPT